MSLKNKHKSWFFGVSASLLAAVLAGCSERPSTDTVCGNFDGGRLVCDVQAPEDMAWLPDGSGLVLSEYGHMGAAEGRLSLYSPDTDQLTILYDSTQPRASITANIWGESGCAEPDYFSPHGIDLTQRGSGRWQLLVVNHGSPVEIADSIQYFELEQIDGLWFAQWRGCVDADSDTILNDVSAAPRGFFTTKFSSELSLWSLLWSYLFASDTGLVLRWSQEHGWKELPGTASSFPNGLHWNREQRELVVNESVGNRASFYTRDGEFLRSVEIRQPDNIVYDPAADRYLVTGQNAGFFETTACMLDHDAPCRMGFTIYSLPAGDPTSIEVVLNEDGSRFGAGTVALAGRQQLFIGSFADNRLYIRDLDHSDNGGESSGRD